MMRENVGKKDYDGYGKTIKKQRRKKKKKMKNH